MILQISDGGNNEMREGGRGSGEGKERMEEKEREENIQRLLPMLIDTKFTDPDVGILTHQTRP